MKCFLLPWLEHFNSHMISTGVKLYQHDLSGTHYLSVPCGQSVSLSIWQGVFEM